MSGIKTVVSLPAPLLPSIEVEVPFGRIRLQNTFLWLKKLLQAGTFWRHHA